MFLISAIMMYLAIQVLVVRGCQNCYAPHKWKDMYFIYSTVVCVVTGGFFAGEYIYLIAVLDMFVCTLMTANRAVTDTILFVNEHVYLVEYMYACHTPPYLSM
jgi:hypothetical protein